jgi:hypothetical protein
MTKVRFAGVLGALLSIAGGLWSQALDVPITVEEIAGVQRTTKPVAFGGISVPFGCEQELSRRTQPTAFARAKRPRPPCCTVW